MALLDGARTLSLRAGPAGVVAAAFVLPAIEEALAEAGAALGDVGLFALAIGPGSFTGLRVGLATVKGLAFASGRPVAAVSTLRALCLAAGSERGPVAAVLDARRGDVYAAVWAPGAKGPEERVREGLYPVTTLRAELPPGCAVAGQAALLGLEPAPFDTCAPAEAVGRLGAEALARGAVERAEDLAPRYLRRAEAEARRLGQPLE